MYVGMCMLWGFGNSGYFALRSILWRVSGFGFAIAHLAACQNCLQAVTEHIKRDYCVTKAAAAGGRRGRLKQKETRPPTTQRARVKLDAARIAKIRRKQCLIVPAVIIFH